MDRNLKKLIVNCLGDAGIGTIRVEPNKLSERLERPGYTWLSNNDVTGQRNLLNIRWTADQSTSMKFKVGEFVKLLEANDVEYHQVWSGNETFFEFAAHQVVDSQRLKKRGGADRVSASVIRWNKERKDRSLARSEKLDEYQWEWMVQNVADRVNQLGWTDVKILKNNGRAAMVSCKTPMGPYRYQIIVRSDGQLTLYGITCVPVRDPQDLLRWIAVDTIDRLASKLDGTIRIELSAKKAAMLHQHDLTQAWLKRHHPTAWTNYCKRVGVDENYEGKDLLV